MLLASANGVNRDLGSTLAVGEPLPEARPPPTPALASGAAVAGARPAALGDPEEMEA